MYPALARATAGRKWRRQVKTFARPYEAGLSRPEIEARQLEKFNEVWGSALESSIFYREWAKRHDLPAAISSLDELDVFPELTKADIVQNADKVFQWVDGREVSDAYVTGGSTGKPGRFPRGAGEGVARRANIFMAREWWGVKMFDPYIHFWGHVHLHAGWKAATKRRIKDRLVNGMRLSSYRTNEAAQAEYAERMLKTNPAYVIGYTSTIFKVARKLEEMGHGPSDFPRLRALFATSETASQADADQVRRTFGIPLALEYGASELGVVAHSRTDTWPLQVLWDSFIVRVNANGELVITSLDDRIFPLVNYRIGDLVDGGDVVTGNALTLGRIKGRAHEVVPFRDLDGERLDFFVGEPVHVLKGIPGVMSVQYRVVDGTETTVLVTGSERLDLSLVRDRLVKALRLGHPNLDPASVRLEQTEEPILTPAGKHQMIITVES